MSDTTALSAQTDLPAKTGADAGVAPQTPDAGLGAGGNAAADPDSASPAGDQAGAGSTEGGPAPGGEAAPAPAPQTYAAFNLPDGVTADEALMDDFGAFARRQGWSQEEAQQAIDLHLQALSRHGEARRQSRHRQQEEWTSQLKTDREYGGPAFSKNVGVAVRAIERFGTPALKEALDASGLGNHPELVRFCYRVGKAIAEDRFVPTHRGGGARTAAEVLYPNQSKE